MIKKYNDFLKTKTNEEFVMAPAGNPMPGQPEIEVPTKPAKPMVEPQPPSIIPDQTEQDAPAKAFYGEEEEEGGDIYQQNLKHLAELLDSEVVNGAVEYQGKKIIFPAETEMFHVDKKKFKTAEEVANYLQKEVPSEEIKDEMDSLKDDSVIDELEEKFESKSYKTKRFRSFTK